MTRGTRPHLPSSVNWQDTALVIHVTEGTHADILAGRGVERVERKSCACGLDGSHIVRAVPFCDACLARKVKREK